MEALLITQASPDCARATTEGRELARPVQGQSAVLASTPTRPPATIQVRKPVLMRNTRSLLDLFGTRLGTLASRNRSRNSGRSLRCSPSGLTAKLLALLRSS
jgi:hypothetical protein